MHRAFLFFSLITMVTVCNGIVIPEEQFYPRAEQEADALIPVSKNGRGPVTNRCDAIKVEYCNWFKDRRHTVSQLPESTRRNMLVQIKQYVNTVYRPVKPKSPSLQ